MCARVCIRHRASMPKLEYPQVLGALCTEYWNVLSRAGSPKARISRMGGVANLLGGRAWLVSRPAGPNTGPEGSKKPPRRSQRAPKSPKIAPRRSRWPQNGRRCLSKTPQEGSRRTLKRGPRGKNH